MAKYFYDKHEIITNTSYTESYSTASYPLGFNLTPLQMGYVYYPGYTFNKTNGKFTLTGNALVKNEGDNPPIGYYNQTVLGGSVYKILSSTNSAKEYYQMGVQSRYEHTSSAKGRLIETITAENGTYPNDGIQGGFWYVRKGLANSAPTISGNDTNLGDKNTGFTINYSVDDADQEDKLTVKEKINGKVIKTLNNAPRNENFNIEITEEMLYSYSLHTTNTIEIEVSDGQGHVAYRRYTFKRTNTAPKISGQDENLGAKTEGFDITFSATDQENDTMSAKIYINDKLVQTYESLVSNQEYTYSLSKLEFVQLNNTDVHKIRIEVQDHNNATALRNYTFTRKLTRIWYAFEKETDIMATQILISPTWHIAEGAEGKVLVCNNVYDEEPTWEDATEQIFLERHYNFINDTKTAENWGVGVQVIMNKGTATELSHLAGFGGAFK